MIHDMCCMPMDDERDSKYTQGKDWSMSENRPMLPSPMEIKDLNRTTDAKIAESGLVLRQPM